MELNTIRGDFSMSHNRTIYIAKDTLPCLVIDSKTRDTPGILKRMMIEFNTIT